MMMEKWVSLGSHCRGEKWGRPVRPKTPERSRAKDLVLNGPVARTDWRRRS